MSLLSPAYMMNQRWQELSLVQKIATIIIRYGHRSKKVTIYTVKLYATTLVLFIQYTS